MTLKARIATGPSEIALSFSPATTTTPVPMLHDADLPAEAAAEPVEHPAKVSWDELY